MYRQRSCDSAKERQGWVCIRWDRPRIELLHHALSQDGQDVGQTVSEELADHGVLQGIVVEEDDGGSTQCDLAQEPVLGPRATGGVV